jgi:hypothetical protein
MLSLGVILSFIFIIFLLFSIIFWFFSIDLTAIGLLLLFTVLTILGFIIWSFFNNIVPISSLNNVSVALSSLNQVCSNIIPCEPGLVCESITNNVKVCKKNIGETCTNIDQCTQNATVCNGLCAISSGGGLNSLCPPCNPGYVCIAQNNISLCKGLPGTVCFINSDCQSNICTSGVCQNPLTLGEACEVGQCEEGLFCSNGVCQELGTTTGQVNSFCNDNVSCVPGFSCVNNVCVSATQTFGETCSSTLVCKEPYQCTCKNGSCSQQICTYPENVNSCITQCSNNFVCSNNECLGTNNMSCISSDNCVSGNCSSTPLIMFWQHTLNGNSSWVKYSSLPTPYRFSQLVAVKKTALLDSLYGLVTSNNTYGGLYILRQRLGNWNLLIELRTEQNGTTYILKKIAVVNNIVYVAANTQSGDGLFILKENADGSGYLEPFNVTNVPGLQYHNGNIINQIFDFDVSTKGDVIIYGSTFSNRRRLFIKRCGNKNYVLSDVIGTQPNFYVGNKSQFNSFDNFTYISTSSRLLLFNGELSGLSYPQLGVDGIPLMYDLYNTANRIWMLTDIDNGNTTFEIFNFQQYQIPGYINVDSLVAVGNVGTYLQSSGHCVG